MITAAELRMRHAALAHELALGRDRYDLAERDLKELDRQLCMLSGALQEIANLIALCEAPRITAEHGDRPAPSH